MKLLAGDLRTGLIQVRNIPALDGSVVVNLNGAGAIVATVQLPLVDPQTGQAIPLPSIIKPGKSFLAFEDNGTIINAGPVWFDKYDFDSGKYEIHAAGLLSYFNYRYILPVLNDALSTDTPVGKDTSYTTAGGTATSLRTIAKRLIVQSRTWTGGDIPITFEPDFYGTNERTYLGKELNEIATNLGYITNVNNGPDIQFVPRFKPSDANYIEWQMKTGNPLLHQQDTTVAINLATNPSFETGTTGMATQTASSGTLTAGVTTSTPDVGSQSGRFTCSVATTALSAYFTNPLTTALVATNLFYYSIRVRSTQTLSLRLRVATWTDAGGTTGLANVDAGADTVLVANTWTTLTMTGTMGAGVLSSRPGLRVTTNISVATTLDIDSVLFKVGSDAVSYFSGATTPVGYSSEWLAAPNASTSRLFSEGPDHIWDTTVPNPAVRAATMTRDGTAFATDNYQQGAIPDAATDPIMAKSYDATLVAAGYPRYESMVNRPTNSDLTLLGNYATDFTTMGRYSMETWSFQADRNATPLFGTYNVGDFAVMVVKNNPRVADGRYRMRIMRISAYITDQFITIDCVPERV